MSERTQLIAELEAAGVLNIPAVYDAFAAIDRADFVPDELRDEAYVNVPLPIGEGQTISQPYTVAFMLDLLQPSEGDTILDVGSGSGWQTALLAHIVGEQGRVVALEVLPNLYEWGRDNVDRHGFLSEGRVEMYCLDGRDGFPKRAPYDGIVAGAAGSDIPSAWRDQLSLGGRIVAPVKSSVLKLTRTSNTEWDQEEHPGFAFVPLVSADS